MDINHTSSSPAKPSPLSTDNLKRALGDLRVQFPRFKHEKHGPIVNVNDVADEKLTMGQRIADKVAATMGSWNFIITQATIMILWIVLNVIGWIFRFDPYPFILLNLAMSAQAAFATPLIMMSQNRQSEKDRLTAQNDYLTDCKGEEEVRHIMDHLDHQDTIILQVVQHLQEQNKRLEIQHRQILTVLGKIDPEMAQDVMADIEQMKNE